MSTLPEGEWAVAESQNGMTLDEVKIVCQGATPWKTGIFLRGRVELFTGGWMSWCWVPNRDDADEVKKSKLYAEVQRPKKRAPSWKEEFSSLPECEWVVADSQRAMYQDKEKLVCRCAKPRKMGIFLRQKVELFTGGWVSWCWVPNDAENEKNNYNLKNLMYEKVFSFSTKTVLNCLTDL